MYVMADIIRTKLQLTLPRFVQNCESKTRPSIFKLVNTPILNSPSFMVVELL